VVVNRRSELGDPSYSISVSHLSSSDGKYVSNSLRNRGLVQVVDPSDSIMVASQEDGGGGKSN